MSVDLPAPFSPTRPSTRPGGSSKLTSLRTGTPKNLLTAPSHSIMCAVMMPPRRWRQAIDFGDRWLEESRSAVLSVPAMSSRPVGCNVLINPAHPNANRIVVSEPFRVPWDERLF